MNTTHTKEQIQEMLDFVNADIKGMNRELSIARKYKRIYIRQLTEFKN